MTASSATELRSRNGFREPSRSNQKYQSTLAAGSVVGSRVARVEQPSGICARTLCSPLRRAAARSSTCSTSPCGTTQTPSRSQTTQSPALMSVPPSPTSLPTRRRRRRFTVPRALTPRAATDGGGASSATSLIPSSIEAGDAAGPPRFVEDLAEHAVAALAHASCADHRANLGFFQSEVKAEVVSRRELDGQRGPGERPRRADANLTATAVGRALREGSRRPQRRGAPRRRYRSAFSIWERAFAM